MAKKMLKVRHIKTGTEEPISEEDFSNLQSMKLDTNLEIIGEADEFTPPESEVPALMKVKAKETAPKAQAEG